MRVLVLGGAGFIGRHAVSALLAAGHQVVVGSRHPGAAAGRLGTSAGHVAFTQARFERLQHSPHWHALLERVDAVLNCVGILRQRGAETYEAVHLRAPTALAAACRDRGLRLVHVSALGLNHPHRSRFLRSKLACEHMLAASGTDYCLVRPSLLDGPDGFGARWLRALARLPLHVLPAGARGGIAALHIDDLGEALARLLVLPLPVDAKGAQREFDLGGCDTRNLADYLGALRGQASNTPAYCLRIPALIARLGSHACDVMHFSPFSFGHWELLRHDNVPGVNRLAELLGRPPRPVGRERSAARPVPLAGAPSR